MRVFLLRLLAFLSCFAPLAVAQTPRQYTITGNLSSISTSGRDVLQAKFTLANCGTANPIVPGVTVPIVKTKLVTADASGNFTDVLWGNDQISCNLGFTTVYQVQYLRNNVPTGIVAQYRILGPGPWNLTTASPVATLPPVNTPASGYFCPQVGYAITGILTDWTVVCSPITAGTLAPVVTTPLGNQTVMQPLGTTLAVNSLDSVLNANLFPGADLGAQIQAADNSLGASAGTIVVTLPGSILTPVSLHDSRSLVFNAPVFEGPVSFHLGSKTDVHCSSPGATLTSNTPGAYIFDFTNSSHVAVHDCSITNITQSGFVLANSGSSVGSSYIAADNLTVLGSAILGTGGTLNSHIHVADSFDTNSQATAGVILFNTIGGVVSNTHFINGVHGVEYWGGDSNGGYTGPDAVTLTGDIVLTNDVCHHVGGACLWGSMGYNVTMANSVADGCGDTCFDPEGSVRVNVTGNVADCTGGNFCYSLFFGSKDNRFADNIGTRKDGATIAILKYSAGNTGPRHRNTVFEHNTFTGTLAGTQAVGFYSEGDADLIFRDNTLTNAKFFENGYHSNQTITGNTLHFDFIPASPFTVFQFGASIGESWIHFNDNIVELSIYGTIAPQFPTGTIAVAATYQDYNNSDFFEFKHNTIKGFPIAISTVNLGLNTGPTAQPHMWTYVSDNFVDHGTISHTAVPTGTGYIEDHYFLTPDNRRYDGGTVATDMYQIVSVTSGLTAATVGATVTNTITLPVPLGETLSAYTSNCTFTPTAGVPQLFGAPVLTATTIAVTTQATTAVAAQGIISCTIRHN